MPKYIFIFKLFKGNGASNQIRTGTKSLATTYATITSYLQSDGREQSQAAVYLLL